MSTHADAEAGRECLCTALEPFARRQLMLSLLRLLESPIALAYITIVIDPIEGLDSMFHFLHAEIHDTTKYRSSNVNSCCRSWKGMLVYCIGSVRQKAIDVVVLAIT
jgi:hypothetical protein